MGVAKSTHQTEVGVLPFDWEVVPLGRLVRSVEYGSSAKSSRQGLFPVLRMGNLQDGRIDWEDLVYTNNQSEFQKYRLRPGDVLFNRTNTIDLVGKTSLFDSDREAMFAGYLIRIVVSPDKLNSRYLNYILNTPVAKRHSLKVLSVAVGQANINGQKLRTYPIPLPPSIGEQEAIAGALADVDAWIESLERLIAKKRQIKLGVMQQLLTGKRRLPGFSEKWPEKRLGELFAVSGGFSASRDQLGADGVCYLHYGDIHTSNKYFIDVDAEAAVIPKLPHALAEGARGAQLDDGDVVFVDASEDVEGTSKHVVIVNPNRRGLISGLHTIVAKSKTDELDHGYRRYCFQTRAVRNQFRFFAVGTKVSGVSKGNIVKIVLPVPPLDEQRAIASVLIDMDAELAAIERKLDKARHVKQAMMQNLLTGRVRLVENKPADQVELKSASSTTQSHNWQINEAVVISVLTKMFGSEQYPLGRKRYTKLSYLLHRHVERKAEGYLKKAAGPYNPATKYGGPEKIALSNGYIRKHKRDSYEGFVAADQIAKAQEYFDKWYGEDSATWLQQFKKARNDDLELWATVDMAMFELRNAGDGVDVTSVKDVIRSHPEWLPKLDRDLFSDIGIASAIQKCEQLFGSDHTET